jgi:hypothetical protein
MFGSSAVASWVAAILVIVLATACSQTPSPESAALAAVIRGAQTAELNVDTMLDLQAELARYYVGTLLGRKVTQYQNALRGKVQAGAGDRIGGVRKLDLKDVQVSGGTAKVKAEVTVWFKTAQFRDQPVTSQPAFTNVIDLDLHLVKNGGTWKIDQEHSQFAPGGGP